MSSQRIRLLFVFSILAMLPTSLYGGDSGKQRRKPNIIVIFTDDQGHADLGIQGVAKDVKTPYIDALARGGVRCTFGYVSAPQCVPSRAGLLTGRYQTRFDLETNLDGPLPQSEITIAERLKAAGYVTGMVGKWHLQRIQRLPPQKGKKRPRVRRFQLDDPHLPHGQGFDDYFCGAKTTYVANRNPKGKPLPKAPMFYKDKRFRIDVQTEAALSFIDRHHEKSFFLYLPYFAPHVPLEAPEKYLKRLSHVKQQKRKLALAMIAAMDDGVGKIMQKLREHDIEENTLIFFISDNGAPLRPAAWNGSLNLPFVGEKGMLTDGGIRVPFIVYWKGMLPRGQVYRRPVISLDVAATAVAVAGLSTAKKLDGVNLLPYLQGQKKTAPHNTLYWRWRSQAAILDGKWKLVKFGRDHRFLFDMNSKHGEKRNLAAAHPDILKNLENKLSTWAKTQTPPGLPQTIHRADQVFFDAHLKTIANASKQSIKKIQGSKRWEKAIVAFEKQDQTNPPPRNAILFVGSSSIRMWKLSKYFPKLSTINRGFGGSEMADVLHFAPRIILKYKPRIIVLYEGDNDISRGKSPEQIRKEFQALVKMIHAVLPGVKIIFLAVKPSPRRWELAETQRRANALIENFCKVDKRLIFVDVFGPMLGKDGQPRGELFLKDRLHLNHSGYQLWTRLVRPHLK